MAHLVPIPHMQATQLRTPYPFRCGDNCNQTPAMQTVQGFTPMALPTPQQALFHGYNFNQFLSPAPILPAPRPLITVEAYSGALISGLETSKLSHKPRHTTDQQKWWYEFERFLVAIPAPFALSGH